MPHKGYYVNGYKFHTRKLGENHVTSNSGVCVKGSWSGDSEFDYYGVLEEVIEVEYASRVPCVVVLFKCSWFDALRGVRVNRELDLIDVKHQSTLSTNDPFVLASQATQVFYLPYPSDAKNLRPWWAVVKSKPRDVYELAQETTGVTDEDTMSGEDVFQETERVVSHPSTSTSIDPNTLATRDAYIEIVLNIEPLSEDNSVDEEEDEDEELVYPDSDDEEDDD